MNDTPTMSGTPDLPIDAGPAARPEQPPMDDAGGQDEETDGTAVEDVTDEDLSVQGGE